MGTRVDHDRFGRKAIRWDEIPDLGKVSDYEIARRVGRRQTVVQRARARRGIPPFQARTPRDEYVAAGIGYEPDAVVAQRTGRSIQGVAFARARFFMGRPDATVVVTCPCGQDFETRNLGYRTAVLCSLQCRSIALRNPKWRVLPEVTFALAELKEEIHKQEIGCNE